MERGGTGPGDHRRGGARALVWGEGRFLRRAGAGGSGPSSCPYSPYGRECVFSETSLRRLQGIKREPGLLHPDSFYALP